MLAMISVRPCRTEDLERVVEILEARRAEYARFEPVFWKQKRGSGPASLAFLASHLGADDSVCLVATEKGAVVGFLFARGVPTPPVYDAGPTAVIDEFYMASPERWDTAGARLLDEARARLREKGFRQIVVISGYRDNAKMVFLRRQGLSLTSAWLTGEL